MPKARLVVFLVALLAVVGLMSMPAARGAQAQGQNLLANPSFEGSYSTYMPNPPHPDCPAGPCQTAQVPSGWWPYWVSRSASDPEWLNRMPEYKPAEGFANRIHSGSNAAQYFTFWGTHTAGLWQSVSVPAGARLRFTVWGHAWSTSENSIASIDPSAVNMKIGVDPTGSGNPWSPAVVWSAAANVYDVYAQFSVDAQAQGSTVTVFVHSAPSEPRMHNDVYWDDASLVVIGAVAPPPTSSGGGSGAANTAPAPAAPAPVGPSATPDADGNIFHVVQLGDSLWSIAARNGLTLDELLEMNGLGREDFISIGDLILIGTADPSVVTLTATEAITETTGDDEEAMTAEAALETAEATPTPAPTAPAAAVSLVQEAPQGGAICLKAYDDANGNGVHDAGEALREAVAFTISDSSTVVSNYVTDGAAEPYCIAGLPSGSYQVTRSTVAGESLTTPGDWAISLVEGGVLNLEFGSRVEDVAARSQADLVAQAAEGETAAPTAAETGAGALTTAGSAADEGGLASGIIIAAVVVALLLLVGVLIVILSARRSAH